MSILSTISIRYRSLPFTYLGVPLFKGRPFNTCLRSIADEVFAQFDNLKGRSLSFAGRACLINFVITLIFVHSFIVYKWPIDLFKHLNQAIRNFLWICSISSKKLFTVFWWICCTLIKDEGLGFKDLVLLNQALLSKLAWKCMVDFSPISAFLRPHFSCKRYII